MLYRKNIQCLVLLLDSTDIVKAVLAKTELNCMEWKMWFLISPSLHHSGKHTTPSPYKCPSLVEPIGPPNVLRYCYFLLRDSFLSLRELGMLEKDDTGCLLSQGVEESFYLRETGGMCRWRYNGLFKLISSLRFFLFFFSSRIPSLSIGFCLTFLLARC